MEYNGERPHSSLAYRTPEEFAKACSELTNRMGLTTPIPPEPPVAGERSQNGTHGQGFANATPKTGAPLTAPCRSAVEYWCDGRLRRDGERGITVDGASQLRLVEKIEAGHMGTAPRAALLATRVFDAADADSEISTASEQATNCFQVLLANITGPSPTSLRCMILKWALPAI
jgi:hypothetical protein